MKKQYEKPVLSRQQLEEELVETNARLLQANERLEQMEQTRMELRTDARPGVLREQAYPLDDREISVDRFGQLCGTAEIRSGDADRASGGAVGSDGAEAALHADPDQ